MVSNQPLNQKFSDENRLDFDVKMIFSFDHSKVKERNSDVQHLTRSIANLDPICNFSLFIKGRCSLLFSLIRDRVVVCFLF